jgi:hypothetical protein
MDKLTPAPHAAHGATGLTAKYGNAGIAFPSHQRTKCALTSKKQSTEPSACLAKGPCATTAEARWTLSRRHRGDLWRIGHSTKW